MKNTKFLVLSILLAFGLIFISCGDNAVTIDGDVTLANQSPASVTPIAPVAGTDAMVGYTLFGYTVTNELASSYFVYKQDGKIYMEEVLNYPSPHKFNAQYLGNMQLVNMSTSDVVTNDNKDNYYFLLDRSELEANITYKFGVITYMPNSYVNAYPTIQWFDGTFTKYVP